MKHHGLFARINNLLRPVIRVNANEPWGRALEDHFLTGQTRRFFIHDSSGLCMEHSTTEGFSVTSRFQAIHEEALSLCRGQILDIGAGTGRDALKLQAMGLNVSPIDVEPRCVEIMHARGLSSARCIDVYDLGKSNFDTILVMQMTIGFAGSLDGLVRLLTHLAALLNEDGQILLDSMSPAYLANSPCYLGQRQIEIHYGRYVGATIPWLYVDYDVLRTCARQISLETQLIRRGSILTDYLARLYKVKNE